MQARAPAHTACFQLAVCFPPLDIVLPDNGMHPTTARINTSPPSTVTPQRLKGHAWIGAEDGSMLDVVGAELLLVGAGSGNETGAVCVRCGTTWVLLSCTFIKRWSL